MMRERGGYSSNKRVEDLKPPPKGRPMSAGDRDRPGPDDTAMIVGAKPSDQFIPPQMNLDPPAGDRDTLTGRISNHDPAELNAVAALVTEGAGPDRHPLFSLRYGIAVAILESDWLAARVRAACEKAWDNGVDTAGQYAEQPWIVDEECKPLNPYRLGDTEQP